MLMKILFISYLYQPSNKIGAVRPTNMSRWLAEFGHDVTVLTNNSQVTTEKGNAKVCAVEHSPLILRGQEKIASVVRARRNAGIEPQGYAVPTAEERKQSLFSKKAFRLFRLWAWDWVQQMDWFFRCRRFCREHLKKDFDVIISSYGPLGSLLLGRWARKKNYAQTWVADMRDPVANAMQGKLVQKYSRGLERSVLRRADRVACVSVGEAEHFTQELSGAEKKLVVIENGFEVSSGVKAATDDGVLRIAYTGMLYLGLSDFSAVFRAVSHLQKRGAVPSGGIEIHYAGPQGVEFLKGAAENDCRDSAVNHGVLPRGEALVLQQKADVLCALSWNTKKAQGILTGKFFEYLRAEKPVLSVVSGEVPEAELSCRVREMNLGFAYEYAAPEDEALCAFLYQAWQCKAARKPVAFDPVREKVLEYRYDNRTRRMEKLCLEALGERDGEEFPLSEPQIHRGERKIH